jgi:thiol:disulfide interchange protein DsbC
MLNQFFGRALIGLATVATVVAVIPTAYADEAEIKKSVEALFSGAKVDAVRKAGVMGLYEVQIGTDIIYSDEKGTYLIQGEILDTKSRKNLTEGRKTKLAQIKFSDLPLELAVKTVKGNGKRVFATFEDPNCGYCKKLAKELAGVTDYTMYTFLFPILAPDSTDKSRAIWCAADQAKAWNDWMVNGVPAKEATCDNPIEKVTTLGQKLGIHGTPTIFFTDGNRIPGFVPAAQLEQMLNKVAAAK